MWPVTPWVHNSFSFLWFDSSLIPRIHIVRTWQKVGINVDVHYPETTVMCVMLGTFRSDHSPSAEDNCTVPSRGAVDRRMLILRFVF